MKRRKVLAMLMTAVMTFTSVAPETAMVALAGDDAEVDVAAEELPFDLKGMPAGYVLDEKQIEMKADLKENAADELDIDAVVFIATRGVFHEHIKEVLTNDGFSEGNIIPVTPMLDIDLRNKYVQRVFL